MRGIVVERERKIGKESERDFINLAIDTMSIPRLHHAITMLKPCNNHSITMLTPCNNHVDTMQ